MTPPFYLTVPENVKITKYMVETLGYNTLEKYGFNNVHIAWNKGKRAIGIAKYYKGVYSIELSTPLFDALKDKREMLDTILHEVAHIIAGMDNHHNFKWRAVCVEIGAKPERCLSINKLDIAQLNYKYELVCEEHGTVKHMSRFPKYNYACPYGCSSEQALTVVEN